MTHANNARYEATFAQLVEPARSVGKTAYEAPKTIQHAMVRAVGAIVKEIKVRATVKEVSKLSDHTLDDIGIDRPKIASLARRAAENPTVDYRVLNSW